MLHVAVRVVRPTSIE